MTDDTMTLEMVLAVTEYGCRTTVPPSLVGPKYGYTAVSEPMTVTFVPLPAETVVAEQLAVIDAKEDALRGELADKLAVLNARRAELRALTYVPPEAV